MNRNRKVNFKFSPTLSPLGILAKRQKVMEEMLIKESWDL